MLSVSQLRAALGTDEADKLSDEEIESLRGSLRQLAEAAIESEERKQQEEAA